MKNTAEINLTISFLEKVDLSLVFETRSITDKKRKRKVSRILFQIMF